MDLPLQGQIYKHNVCSFLTSVIANLPSCTNHTIMAADRKVRSDCLPGTLGTNAAAYWQGNLSKTLKIPTALVTTKSHSEYIITENAKQSCKLHLQVVWYYWDPYFSFVAIPYNVLFLYLEFLLSNCGCLIKFADSDKVHFSIWCQLPGNQVIHGDGVSIIIKLGFITKWVNVFHLC